MLFFTGYPTVYSLERMLDLEGGVRMLGGHMVGVGKLMKQAAKMQQQLQALQEELAQTEMEVSGGGGAVQIKITLAQEIKSIRLDPEFLKEDRALIEEALTEAVRDAVTRSKAVSEQKMGAITSGFSLPGMM